MENPLEHIKSSCSAVTIAAKDVFINDENIQKLANELLKSDFADISAKVAWDASGWHYNGQYTCQYIFVLDALNFCFWPTLDLEYHHLAIALKDVLESDSHSFDADRLVNMDENTLQSWMPSWTIPLLAERVACLQELGEVLLEYYGGLASNLVLKAENSANKLIQLLHYHFKGFQDVSRYQEKDVSIYKRAQILCGDLWAAYGRPQSGPYHFTDISQLTMFADYRVPQILRAFNVLEYSEQLSTTIDNKIEILKGATQEIEIRACTIIAVDRLHKEMQKLGLVELLVIEVDWLLWQRAEESKDVYNPHHRTRTIFY